MNKLVKITRSSLLAAVVWVGWAQAPQVRPVAAPETKAVSTTEIQSLLDTSCVSCHSGERAAGDLRLDSLAGLAKGGTSGSAVVPGNAGASQLFQRVVTSDRALRMPLAVAPLSTEKIALLKSWIENGADGMPRARLDTSVDFGRDVKPILAASCFGCHSGATPKSQLRLDSKAVR